MNRSDKAECSSWWPPLPRKMFFHVYLREQQQIDSVNEQKSLLHIRIRTGCWLPQPRHFASSAHRDTRTPKHTHTHAPIPDTYYCICKHSPMCAGARTRSRLTAASVWRSTCTHLHKMRTALYLHCLNIYVHICVFICSTHVNAHRIGGLIYACAQCQRRHIYMYKHNKHTHTHTLKHSAGAAAAAAMAAAAAAAAYKTHAPARRRHSRQMPSSCSTNGGSTAQHTCVCVCVCLVASCGCTGTGEKNAPDNCCNAINLAFNGPPPFAPSPPRLRADARAHGALTTSTHAHCTPIYSC